MNYEPLEDCVLVEKIESENDKSGGGILLPDKINERPIMAEVLAVGPGVKMDDGGRYPMMLCEGDTVVFPRKSGDHLLIDGKELIVIPERYILMRVLPELGSNGFTISENDDNDIPDEGGN
jgi:chaperonin GroES